MFPATILNLVGDRDAGARRLRDWMLWLVTHVNSAYHWFESGIGSIGIEAWSKARNCSDFPVLDADWLQACSSQCRHIVVNCRARGVIQVWLLNREVCLSVFFYVNMAVWLTAQGWLFSIAQYLLNIYILHIYASHSICRTAPCCDQDTSPEKHSVENEMGTLLLLLTYWARLWMLQQIRQWR